MSSRDELGKAKIPGSHVYNSCHVGGSTTAIYTRLVTTSFYPIHCQARLMFPCVSLVFPRIIFDACSRATSWVYKCPRRTTRPVPASRQRSHANIETRNRRSCPQETTMRNQTLPRPSEQIPRPMEVAPVIFLLEIFILWLSLVVGRATSANVAVAPPPLMNV